MNVLPLVLLEVTTEYTVRKPEACSPLRASPSLEYAEEENLTEYRRFAAYGISQKESVYGIRDTKLLDIPVFSVSKAVFCVFSSLYCDESI